jgi:hypothetical protein
MPDTPGVGKYQGPTLWVSKQKKPASFPAGCALLSLIQSIAKATVRVPQTDG